MATNYRGSFITSDNLGSFRVETTGRSLISGYYFDLTGFWKTNDIFRTIK